MKVMFCMSGPSHLNGPNIWLLRHLPLLRERGIDPCVLYVAWDASVPCRNLKRLGDLGIPYTTLSFGDCLESDIVSVFNRVMEEGCDVFVPNYLVPGYYASRYLIACGIPCVGVLHSDDPFYHDIVDLFVAGEKDWRLSAVVCVSNALTDLVGGLGHEIPVLVAPCGAPVSVEKAHREDSRLRVFYFGRLVDRQKRILRLTSHLVNACREIPVLEAVLFGDGEESAEVRSIIRNAEAEEKVKMGGLVDPDRILEVMRSGHVFLLLSDFEGLSIAMMEAMSCGLVPVVSNMRSGVSDLIRHGENGFVVDPDNLRQLIDCLEALASDPDRWERMSTNARRSLLNSDMTSASCATKWAEFLNRSEFMNLIRETGWTMLRIQDICLPPSPVREDGMMEFEHRSPRQVVMDCVSRGRPVYLWGASGGGMKLLSMQPEIRQTLSGVIDSDSRKQGSSFSDLMVFSPFRLESGQCGPIRPFVVVASFYADEISKQLDRMGYARNKDYVVALAR